tara:strand:+ start:72 stop:842 length:771 start_codon:yes stop_codon:yes gene_type:complete
MIYYILPAYNEDLNILNLLNNFNNFFLREGKDYKSKVVIIDDGSRDNTKSILENLKKNNKIFDKEINFELINIFHEKNRGLGEALKSGMTYCLKDGNPEDVIVTMDCDNSHSIELSKIMIDKIRQGNDVIIASRYKRGANTKGLSVYRKLLSYVGCMIFKITFPIKNIEDYTCGYRAFNLEKFKEAFDLNKNFFSEKGFTVSVDIILKLRKFDKYLKMDEVPMILRYDLKKGESKMSIFKTIFQTLLLLFRRKFFN